MSTLLSPNARLLKEGKGRLFIAPFDVNGVASAGLIDMGNLKNFGYTNKPTIDKMYSNLGGPSYLYDAAITQLDGDIEIEGTEFSPEVNAILYSGTAATFTQASSTAVAEPVTTSLVLGSFYKLAHRNVTVPLTDLKIGATTLVPGPDVTGDYQVINPLTGLIQINLHPVTGAVVAGAAVTADYAYAAITALDQISIATAGLLSASLLFVPKNARGIDQELFLYNVLFEPETGPSFVSDKYTTWKAKASVLNDYLSAAGAHGGTASIPVGYILNQTAT